MISTPAKPTATAHAPPPADPLAEGPGSGRGQHERAGKGEGDGVGEGQVPQARDEEEHRRHQGHGPQQAVPERVRHPQHVQASGPVHEHGDRYRDEHAADEDRLAGRIARP